MPCLADSVRVCVCVCVFPVALPCVLPVGYREGGILSPPCNFFLTVSFSHPPSLSLSLCVCVLPLFTNPVCGSVCLPTARDFTHMDYCVNANVCSTHIHMQYT